MINNNDIQEFIHKIKKADIYTLRRYDNYILAEIKRKENIRHLTEDIIIQTPQGKKISKRKNTTIKEFEGKKNYCIICEIENCEHKKLEEKGY